MLYELMPSIVGTPMILHSADATIERVGAGATITVTLHSEFVEVDGVLGTGKALMAAAFYVLQNGTTARAEAVLKATDAVWSAPATQDAELTLALPNAGDAKSIALYIETYRTDNAYAAGVHSYSTMLLLPAALPPSAPAITLSIETGRADAPITIHAENSGAGSGAAFSYAFQYRRNAGAWIVFEVTAETDVVFTPSIYGGSYNDTFRFRVTLYNTLGLAATSPQSVPYICAARPAAPLGVAGVQAYFSSATAPLTFLISYDQEEVPPAAFDIEVSLDGAGWQQHVRTFTTSFTLAPDAYFLTYGHALHIRAIAVDAAEQQSLPSPECIMQYYPRPYAVSRIYAVPESANILQPIQVYWMPTTGAAQYTLECKIDNADWVLLDTIAAGTYVYTHTVPRTARDILYRVRSISVDGVLPQDDAWTLSNIVHMHIVRGCIKQGALLLNGNVYAIMNAEAVPMLQLVEV